MRPNCPAVVRYQVVFGNGEVKYPSLPGHVNVYKVAEDYANSKNTHVVSIERLY